MNACGLDAATGSALAAIGSFCGRLVPVGPTAVPVLEGHRSRPPEKFGDTHACHVHR